MICPTELKRNYKETRVIPFIGAGISQSVKWGPEGNEKKGPSWKELVDQAIKFLGFEQPELARIRGTDLQILEYYKHMRSDQIAELTNWLLQNMNPPDANLLRSPIHSELVKLENCPIFYTTNYDDFLERAFNLHSKTNTVIATEKQMGGKRETCEIIKFHGDWNHPDKIVLTESDYENRLSFDTAMDHRLKSDLLGHVLLFLGYSFRDPNVSYLFRLFIDRFKNESGSLKGKRAYIAVPDPSAFEIDLFKKREIEVISIRSIEMENDICELLNEIRG